MVEPLGYNDQLNTVTRLKNLENRSTFCEVSGVTTVARLSLTVANGLLFVPSRIIIHSLTGAATVCLHKSSASDCSGNGIR